MAKKQVQQVVTKTDPKRDRTVQNRIKRLERHLRHFPEDKVAQAALKREKPSRQKPKVKGAHAKPVVKIREASGFVSSKHRVGAVLFFGSQEPIIIENGKGGFTVNQEIVSAWKTWLAKAASQQKKRR